MIPQVLSRVLNPLIFNGNKFFFTFKAEVHIASPLEIEEDVAFALLTCNEATQDIEFTIQVQAKDEGTPPLASPVDVIIKLQVIIYFFIEKIRITIYTEK